MDRTTRALAGLFIAALSLVAGGCGDTELDRDGSVESLVDQGVPRAIAECVVDRIDAEYGDDPDTIEQLTNSDERDPALQARLTAIFTECTADGEGTSSTTSGG